MALTKSDIQELLTASEERLSAKFDSQIAGVEKRLEQTIKSTSDSLEGRLNHRIDNVEERLKQEIKSSNDSLEEKLGEKITSESQILQILFNHVLKNQDMLKENMTERFTHIDHAITKAAEDHQEVCDDVVELQSDVEQLKLRVFGVK